MLVQMALREHFFLDWLLTTVLPISASQKPRIIGVNHWPLATAGLLPLQVQLVDSTYLGLKIFIEKHKY
jgi:hypothetical protein